MRPGLLVCSGTDGRHVAIQPDADVDASVVAERGDGVAGPRVDGPQRSRVQVEEPAIRSIGALPIVDAAIGDGALVPARPFLLPRHRVERHDRVVARQHVHRPIDDDRIEAVAPGIGGRIGPRHFQPGDVRPVDLIERRVLRRVGAAEVLRPGFERPGHPARLAAEEHGDAAGQQQRGGDRTPLIRGHETPFLRSFGA